MQPGQWTLRADDSRPSNLRFRAGFAGIVMVDNYKIHVCELPLGLTILWQFLCIPEDDYKAP